MYKLTGSLNEKYHEFILKKTRLYGEPLPDGRMMRTQAEQATDRKITAQMRDVAWTEGVNPEALREKIAEGSAVIMLRGKRYTGIGKGLSIKVNVNLGSSSTKVSVDDEIQKAIIAETFGADTISDLSMGGDINAIRKEIFSHTTLPITTVPIYQAVIENGFKKMIADDIMATFRMQMDQGISSVVIHGVSREMLTELRRKKRLLGMVSKGSSITSAFMLMNQCENPFIEHFDEVLSLCKKHDIVLSLENTARSGCIHDRRDRMQIAEIRQNIQLADRARSAGVQVIIEGAGGSYPERPYCTDGEVLQKAVHISALCCRTPAHRCCRRVRSYCRRRLPLLRHPGRASRASRTGGVKRGPDCIQDRCTHRGYRKILTGGGRHQDCPAAGSSLS